MNLKEVIKNKSTIRVLPPDIPSPHKDPESGKRTQGKTKLNKYINQPKLPIDT